MSIIVEIGNVTIRQFEKSDLQTFTRYRAIPEVAQYQSWSNYTYDDAIK
ncbi:MULTISPECIES: hypothetical protein [unclassified Shewanella]|jgi:hypothetical protein|nr:MULTISPECIES: hypothetical protein [unclassified Shewanella]